MLRLKIIPGKQQHRIRLIFWALSAFCFFQSPASLAENGLSTDKFLIFSAPDLLNIRLTQERVEKFVSILPNLTKQYSPLEEKDFKNSPLSAMLLDDLKKNGFTSVSIPQDIQDFFKKYYLAENPSAGEYFEEYLLILLGAEAGVDLRCFPKTLVNLLTSQGWKEPKEFISTQFQVMRTLSLFTGLDLAEEIQKMFQSIDQLKKTAPSDLKNQKNLKMIVEKLQYFPTPDANRAFLELVKKRLDPSVVPLVTKIRSKVDQIIKSTASK